MKKIITIKDIRHALEALPDDAIVTDFHQSFECEWTKLEINNIETHTLTGLVQHELRISYATIPTIE